MYYDYTDFILFGSDNNFVATLLLFNWLIRILCFHVHYCDFSSLFFVAFFLRRRRYQKRHKKHFIYEVSPCHLPRYAQFMKRLKVPTKGFA